MCFPRKDRKKRKPKNIVGGLKFSKRNDWGLFFKGGRKDREKEARAGVLTWLADGKEMIKLFS